MAHFEKQLASETKFEGRIFTVTVDDIELEDGGKSKREIVHHHGGACILPLFDNGDICLVRQFRYAYGKELWELPAGKLEKGEKNDIRSAALRELKEETGATCKELIYLGEMYPSPALLSEVIYMYFARGLSFGERDLDDDEFLECERVSLDRIIEMIEEGLLPDAKTQIAALRVRKILNDEKNI